jgi:hypothetical protein
MSSAVVVTIKDKKGKEERRRKSVSRAKEGRELIHEEKKK